MDDQSPPEVKICGITNLPDARFVAGALVDYMGFIFYEKSDRYISPAKAGAIINWIEGPRCVGVFVNQPLDDVNMIARQTGIDLVQLHGSESPEYCDLVDQPIIKAIGVANDTTPSLLEKEIARYRPHVDYLLFDTKIEGQAGGTGQTFDWKCLPKISSDISFFLSGGLNAANVRRACSIVHPFAVDVASGVEDEPGKKSFDKIEAFMHQMRSKQQSL